MTILRIGGASSLDGRKFFASDDLTYDDDALFWKKSRVLTEADFPVSDGTTPEQIADAVRKSHAHANMDALEKLSDSGGRLTYDGIEVGSGSVKSVNGVTPDETGDVEIETGGGCLLPPPGSVPEDLTGNPVVFLGRPVEDCTLLLMHFDDETYSDETGLNRPQALEATPSIVAGRFGNGIHADTCSGGKHALKIPWSDAFRADAWTLEFFVKLDSPMTALEQTLLSFGEDGGGFRIMMRVAGDGFYFENGDRTYSTFRDDPNADQWYFLAVQFDGTRTRLYEDGALLVDAECVPDVSGRDLFLLDGARATIDELRWTKGLRYPEGDVPVPAEPFDLMRSGYQVSRKSFAELGGGGIAFDQLTDEQKAELKGEPGRDGASAGFGTPEATVETLEPGRDATVSVTAEGDDSAKVFVFRFGIPKGDPGVSDAPGASDGRPTRKCPLMFTCPESESALHLEIEYSETDGGGGGFRPLLKSSDAGSGGGKVRGYTGDGWVACPEKGFGSSFGGWPVMVDLTEVSEIDASKLYYIRYRWVIRADADPTGDPSASNEAADIASDWYGMIYPCATEAPVSPEPSTPLPSADGIEDGSVLMFENGGYHALSLAELKRRLDTVTA